MNHLRFASVLIFISVFVCPSANADWKVSCRVTEPKPWFVDRFTATFEITPERASYGTYDTLMMYAEAIKKADSFDPKIVRPIFAKMKYDGASGKFEFNDIGDALRTPSIKVVKEGRFVHYE